VDFSNYIFVENTAIFTVLASLIRFRRLSEGSPGAMATVVNRAMAAKAIRSTVLR